MGLGRRQASMPVSVVDSHHPANSTARKMIGAATVSAPRGLFRSATTYFPTPGVRAAQQTHGCASCTPPIRTITVGAGISPAQPPSFCEGGSRTITAGSDFHRPRSTHLTLCHRPARNARRIRHKRKSTAEKGDVPRRPPMSKRSVRVRMSVCKLTQCFDLPVRVFGPEDRGTCDEVIRTGLGGPLDRCTRNASVDLD